MSSPILRLVRGAGGLLTAASLALALVGVAAPAPAAAAGTPFCGITWGSLPKAAVEPSPAPLLDLRTGQHDCYDRVVLDFAGPASAHRVQYTDAVFSQCRGAPLDVAGGAKLEIVLRGPAGDSFPHATGEHLADVSGYRTLLDAVYGGSFEGYATLGVGVRARLPFRVFTVAGPGGNGRIVLDVAHRWSA